MPKRRKNSCTGSSASSAPDWRLRRCTFSVTDTLTTAGPTCSTSVAKSGSTRPFNVPTGCGDDGGCEGMATGAGCESCPWLCAAATEDWGEQAPAAMTTTAMSPKRFATNSDISANPQVRDKGERRCRNRPAEFLEVQRMEKPWTWLPAIQALLARRFK